MKNILLLDSEGKRVAVKYYSDEWPTNAAKDAYEKAVFAKTQKTNARTEGGIMLFYTFGASLLSCYIFTCIRNYACHFHFESFIRRHLSLHKNIIRMRIVSLTFWCV